MRALALLWLGLWWQTAVGVTIPAVAYHDIVETRNGDPYAITVAQFEEQLAYLKQKGYQPISLRDLEAARRNVRPLPAKPVLLTFDDGLQSFYTKAWPRLQRYGYPAVVSIVTSWVDGRRRPDWDSPIMTWDELRVLADTPAVELISHGDDIHRGIVGDAAGTFVPAATTRAFNAATQAFEDEERRRARVTSDLARSVARMRAELRLSPRAIAWPYGEYDAIMVAAAAALGIEFHLTLSDRPTTLEGLPRINRFTLHGYRQLSDFAAALAFRAHEQRDRRFVQVDFDVFHGLANAARAAVLDRQLERLQLLRVNAVILAPFSKDGASVFFRTSAMAVEDDIALRVTMSILRRTAIERIYVRLPANLLGDRLIALAADYLRRHPLHGLLIDGPIDRNVADRLRSLVDQYRPDARLYVGFDGPRIEGVARWRELAARTVTDTTSSLTGLDTDTTLILVRRDGAPDAMLTRALETLRRAGVRHYGYTSDDADANRPDARLVVAPLHAHTIRPGS